VAATAAGGIPEVAADGSTALLVPPRDPPALAGALLRLLGDAALRAELGRAGREAARARFGIDRMVEGTLEIYGQVLAEKGLA
jgi:glycosyltransferase involved in cell wall biosynthesis